MADNGQHSSPSPAFGAHESDRISMTDASGESGSYFTSEPSHFEPKSPIEVAKDTRTSAELLRRLSLVDQTQPSQSELDPCKSHPSLELSGNLISATICIPYSLGFRESGSWVSLVNAQVMFGFLRADP